MRRCGFMPHRDSYLCWFLGFVAIAQATSPLSSDITAYSAVTNVQVVELAGAPEGTEHAQPFGGKLRLTFRAFDMEHEAVLWLNTALYHRDYKVYVHGEGEAAAEPFAQQLRVAYVGRTTEGDWVRATLFPDGGLHVTLRHGGDILVVDPVRHHPARTLHTRARDHLEGVGAEMVAYWLSDVAVGQDGAFHDDMAVPLGRAILNAGRRKPLVKFAGCPDEPQALSLGVAVDEGYFIAAGGTADAVNSLVAAIVNSMNGVYSDQLNVQFVLAATVIQSTSGGPEWNEKPTSSGAADCPTAIATKLDLFSAWRGAEHGNDGNGLWMLLNDCYTSAGTVGLAWVGTVCVEDTVYCPGGTACARTSCPTTDPTGDYDSGGQCSSGTSVVSNLGATTWVVAAHEIGHNFGGSHTSGGIMAAVMNNDRTFAYASGDEMCPTVESAMSSYPSCFTSTAPVCGNSVVEAPDEECDDDSACCDDCQLAAGAECSVAPGSVSEPCCVSCQVSYPTVACNGDLGYCASGRCELSDCPKYDRGFCDVEAAAPCLERCEDPDTAACEHDFPHSEIAGSDLQVADLTPCADDRVCYGGECITTDPDWRAGEWSPCSLACGGGFASREVTCADPYGNTATSCDDDAKPNTTQPCNTFECGDYYWLPGSFGACSAPCGGGDAVRAVECYGEVEEAAVDDSKCNSTDKPALSMRCNTDECMEYNWVPGPWKDCCGEPQERDITCQDINATIVDASLCTTSEPESRRLCIQEARSCPADSQDGEGGAPDFVDDITTSGFGALNDVIDMVGVYGALGILVGLCCCCCVVTGLCCRKKKATQVAPEKYAQNGR